MATPLRPRTTTAFYVQSALSFGVSLAALALGIIYLPLNGWPRAFLALGVLYSVTSAFGLAKCVCSACTPPEPSPGSSLAGSG
jgi:hypothetical protein